MEIYYKSAGELSKDIKNKKLSCTELTKAVFDRIDKVENKVESFITLNYENAMKKAKEVDEKLSKGEVKSNLAGIPIAIKDNISTKGIPTTCASKMLEGYKPPYNATVVEKLIESDAVIVGKVNMDEFAMGSSCENSAFKKTKNPHDLSRVPGGSSGGSAACVAAGEAVCSLGSDTGGSIRQPASYCGVAGLKPTYGAVSRYGLVAFASSLDQIGPLARSIEDIALMANAIYGHDENDSTSLNIKHKDFTKSLIKDVTDLRIGVPKEYFGDAIDDEVKEAVQKTIKNYEKMGAKIKEIRLPLISYALPVYYIISSAEASSNLARYDGVKYGYRAKEFTDVNSLITKSRSEGFGDEVKRRILLGTYVLSSGYYDAYYKKAQAAQKMIKADFSEAFKEIDLILTPVTPETAFKIGEKIEEPTKMYLNDICTVSVNIAGLPAIVFPCGKDKNNLPIGVQLIGAANMDGTLIRAAYGYEQEFDIWNGMFKENI